MDLGWTNGTGVLLSAAQIFLSPSLIGRLLHGTYLYERLVLLLTRQCFSTYHEPQTI